MDAGSQRAESLIESYYSDIERVMDLLSRDEQSARRVFNAEIYPRYSAQVMDDSGPLRPFSFFFLELDEYLNSHGARTLGQATEERISWSYEEFLSERPNRPRK